MPTTSKKRKRKPVVGNKHRPKGSPEMVLRGLYGMYQRHVDFAYDPASDHETIVKSSNAAVQLGLTILRYIEFVREAREREFLSQLAVHDAQERLALRQGEDVDTSVEAELVDDGLPPDWEGYCEQAWRRGCHVALEQSLALYQRPRAAKEIVQASVLGQIGRIRPGEHFPPMAPAEAIDAIVEPSPAEHSPPIAPPRDPEQDRLDTLEAEVRTLVNGLKRTIPPPATPPGHLG